MTAKLFQKYPFSGWGESSVCKGLPCKQKDPKAILRTHVKIPGMAARTVIQVLERQRWAVGSLGSQPNLLGKLQANERQK